MSEQSQRNISSVLYKTKDDAQIETPQPKRHKTPPAGDMDEWPLVGDGDDEFKDVGADGWAGLSKDAADYATSKTPKGDPYPWWTWVRRYSEFIENLMKDVQGAVIATERQNMRAHVKKAVEAVKAEVAEQTRELALTLREQNLEANRAIRADAKATRDRREEVTRRELDIVSRELADLRERASREAEATQSARAAMREEMARERELSARAAGVEQSRHDLVLRELGVLRSEVAVERELRELHAEIAAAQAAIPRVAELEARVETKLTQQAVKLKRQEAELAKTKDRLGKLRVDHALVENRLANYIKEAAKVGPRVDLEMFSSFTRFSVKDLSPSNAQALAEFATQTVDQSGAPIFVLPPVGTA